MTNAQLITFLKSIGCEAQSNDAPSLAFARKVIEALEDVTPAMRWAGGGALPGQCTSDECVGVYQAMFAARFGE